MLNTFLFIAGAYLWGAVPTTYLAGRYLKGIDIRRYGSGNVGAANLITLVDKRIGFLLGTFDCLAKGTLPIVMAKLLDQSLAVQGSMGLAAIAGHNWSPYIRFTGGRGVATAVGVVFGLKMWPEFLILTVVMGLIGYLIFRESGAWTFVAMLVLPLLAWLFDRPPEIIYMTLIIAVLLMFKRLTANWVLPSGEVSLLRVMAYRALWDRDVPRRMQWTGRGLSRDEESSSRDVGDEVLH